ncbi:hypothetical protein GK011_21155, partial [Erwinia sp. J316]|nr:hypothetical protein [Erwinia sorbitola]
MTDNGGPQVGSSARTLGVRPGTDIPVDQHGNIHPNTGGTGADCRTEYEYRTVSFDFDAAGQLAGERNHGGQYRYGYDAGGSLVSTAYPDGSRLLHCRYGSGHLLQS